MKDQSLNINKKKEQLEIFKGRREKRKKQKKSWPTRSCSTTIATHHLNHEEDMVTHQMT
jgi:hypothetical protein